MFNFNSKMVNKINPHNSKNIKRAQRRLNLLLQKNADHLRIVRRAADRLERLAVAKKNGES